MSYGYRFRFSYCVNTVRQANQIQCVSDQKVSFPIQFSKLFKMTTTLLKPQRIAIFLSIQMNKKVYSGIFIPQQEKLLYHFPY